MKIVLATDNTGKISEFQRLLPDFNWLPQGEYSIQSPEETGLCFIENAIIKARHAAKISGLPALADDSGIIIDALDGRPGVNSARYAGDHDFAANIKKVLAELEGISLQDRTARFCCTLAYLRSFNDPCPIVVSGFWEGIILEEPVGQNGFGYDPIFYDTELKSSAAEISSQVKNNRSHRAKAIKSLISCLCASPELGQKS